MNGERIREALGNNNKHLVLRLEDVNDSLNKKKQEKIDFIREIIKQRDYDSVCLDRNGEEQEVLTLLLYEYAQGIENVTNGRMKFKEVAEQLTGLLGKLRFGWWRESDSNVRYGRCIDDPEGMSVSSEEYKQATKNFGAGTCEYYDESSKYKVAIALLRTDLKNLNDIRHTLFHEWTHAMEKCLIPIEAAGRDGIPNEKFLDDGRLFNNARRISETGELLFCGVSTSEIDENDNITQMHNQIDEGFVEEIAKKVMTSLGYTIDDPDRYYIKCRVANQIMSGRGEARTITEFLTKPYVIIDELENIDMNLQDGRKVTDILHFVSDAINEYDNSFKEFDNIASKELKVSFNDIKQMRRHEFFKKSNFEKENDKSVEDFRKIAFESVERATCGLEEDEKNKYRKRISNAINGYVRAKNDIEVVRGHYRSIVREQSLEKKEHD